MLMEQEDKDPFDYNLEDICKPNERLLKIKNKENHDKNNKDNYSNNQ